MQQTFDSFVLWMLEHLSPAAEPIGFLQWLLAIVLAVAFIVSSYFAVKASALRMFQGKSRLDWLNMAVTALVAVLFMLPALRSLQWGVKPALAAAAVKFIHLTVLIPAALVALLVSLIVLAFVPSWRADLGKTKAGLKLAGLYTTAMLTGVLFYFVFAEHRGRIEVFFLINWLLGLLLFVVKFAVILVLIAMAYFGVRAMLNGFWLADLHRRLAGVYKTVFGVLFLASVWVLHQAFETAMNTYGKEGETIEWSDVSAVLPGTTEVVAAGILIVYGLVCTFIEIPGSDDLLTEAA